MLLDVSLPVSVVWSVVNCCRRRSRLVSRDYGSMTVFVPDRDMGSKDTIIRHLFVYIRRLLSAHLDSLLSHSNFIFYKDYYSLYSIPYILRYSYYPLCSHDATKHLVSVPRLPSSTRKFRVLPPQNLFLTFVT